jgi:hypothetical protein
MNTYNLSNMNRRECLQLVGAAVAGMLLPVHATSSSSASARLPAKRGLGMSTKPDNRWREKLELCGARWFYTWNRVPPEDIPAGVEFIPMIWNGKPGDSYVELGRQLRKAGHKELLGFNEPDQAKQGNMTVEAALDLWPKLMETGMRLVSPSCVHPDKDWMKAFMKGVEERKLRVDAVGVHSYGGPNADALMKRLATVHEMFGRPLWITEFAVGDWNAKTRAENRHRPEQVVEFVRQLFPQLDACEFVERYAWFPARPDSAPLGPSALFHEDGTLTPVGAAYHAA